MASGRAVRSVDGMQSAPICVERVTKRYGPITAVEDLSFQARAGAITGFLGPNGAGKTSTLRMLLGLATPTAGSAAILGRRYHDLDDPAGTVGALLDANGFHPWRSARSHLRIVAAAAGVPGKRVGEVLDEVGLADAGERRVGGFSLGMRQRLGLAGALLGRPRVLLLDEPANGLDPDGIRWLRGFLRAYADDGNTVLISSHLLSEIQQTAMTSSSSHAVACGSKARWTTSTLAPATPSRFAPRRPPSCAAGSPRSASTPPRRATTPSPSRARPPRPSAKSRRSAGSL
jgi:ABC-2 type transport system ATP-binding protein